MSDNFPEKNIVDKLTQLGGALQGNMTEEGHFPPNFPGKKVADKIDELIAIARGGKVAGDYDNMANKPAIDGHELDKDSTAAGLGLETVEDAGSNEDLATAEKGTLVGAINEVSGSITAEALAREAYDQQQDRKLETLNGHYFPLDGYDFGKTLDVKTPNPDDVMLLTTYAMTMEGVSDPAQIIDGTVIKNEFDGVEFVWNAVTQAWTDWGVGNIVTAGNDHLGVVEGTADLGDGSKDSFVTVRPGGLMETIGFTALKGRVAAAEESIAGKVDKNGTDRLMTADEGSKLEGIQAGAQVNPGPATTDAAGLMSKEDKAKMNSVALLRDIFPSYGNTIPSGANLNDYLYNGKFLAVNSTIAATIVNSPTTSAFILDCSCNSSAKPLPNDALIIQSVTQVNNGNEFVRYCKVGSTDWTSWKSTLILDGKYKTITLKPSVEENTPLIDLAATNTHSYLAVTVSQNATISTDQFTSIVNARKVRITISSGITLTVDGPATLISYTDLTITSETVSNRGKIVLNTPTITISSSALYSYAINFVLQGVMRLNFSAANFGGSVFTVSSGLSNSPLFVSHASIATLNNMTFASGDPYDRAFIDNTEGVVIFPSTVAYAGSPNIRKLITNLDNAYGQNTGFIVRSLMYLPDAYLFKNLTAAEWTDLKSYLSVSPQAIVKNINAATNKPDTGPSECTLEIWQPHSYYVMVRLTIVVASTQAERGDVYQGFWADASGAGNWQGWKKLTP